MQGELYPDPTSARYIKLDEGSNYWQKLLYNDKYLCIMHCKVKAPKRKVMVLPFRDKGKLKFPYGTFKGYWTSVELKQAIRYGYQIQEVYEVVAYTRTFAYFKDYAEFVWGKRLKYRDDGNTGMDEVMKYVGNALYGKFAQRNDVGGYFGKACDAPYFDDKAIVQFYKYGSDGELWSKDGELWVQIQGTEQPAKHEFPCISAFVASYTRVRLLDALKANEDNIVYCDTDSIKVRGEAQGIDIGKELGQWGFEGIATMTFYRPKFYGNICKGIPGRAKLVYDGVDSKVFEFDKPLREREAIKSGRMPDKWVTITKEVTLQDDKRLWFGNESEPLPFDVLTVRDDDAGRLKVTAIPIELRWQVDPRYKPKLRIVDSDNVIEHPEDEALRDITRLTRRRDKVRF